MPAVEDNEELECATISFYRNTIGSNAISIPQYPDAPELVYLAQGRRMHVCVFHMITKIIILYLLLHNIDISVQVRENWVLFSRGF